MSTTSLAEQVPPAHRRPRRPRGRAVAAALSGGLAAGLALVAPATPAAAAPWGEDPEPAMVATAEVVDAVTGEVATVAVLAPGADVPVPAVAGAPATVLEAAPVAAAPHADLPSPAARSLPVTGAASRYELLIAALATAGGIALRLWVSLARRR